MSEIQKGSCFCRSVQFEFSRPLFCCHCHCESCRKIHGSAFLTWTGVQEENFTFIKGEKLLTPFKSSPQVIRSFCTKCGTHVIYTSTKWPGTIFFPIVRADESIEILPSKHIHIDEAVNWFPFDDSLPKVEGNGE